MNIIFDQLDEANNLYIVMVARIGALIRREPISRMLLSLFDWNNVAILLSLLI